MKPSVCAATLAVLVAGSGNAWGYVEVPYTLGQVCKESTHIVLMEVSKINKEKGLLYFKKVEDLKGKHPVEEIKHNIGKRGFHPRESENILKWAVEGQKAIFFHNGGASETCIGTYWYQCYPEGEWWGLSHAEPFLLRTFYGEIDKLKPAVVSLLKNEEVTVTCLADGKKEDLHLRKGKLQTVRASLKRLNYDMKRDFVGFGGDGVDFPEYKTVSLLPESADGFRFLPAEQVKALGERWKALDFDDGQWRAGKAPIGYGEEELNKRKGTAIAEKGVPFVFRKTIDVPATVLNEKGVILRIAIASDDAAQVFLNGALVDDDMENHEFSYWNREIELQPKQFKPGKNVIAILVKNAAASSDLYLDMEVTAQVPVPKPPKK